MLVLPLCSGKLPQDKAPSKEEEGWVLVVLSKVKPGSKSEQQSKARDPRQDKKESVSEGATATGNWDAVSLGTL